MMKKIKLILVTAMIVSFTFAQEKVRERDLPTTVKNEFNKRYPRIDASDVNWEKVNSDYRATFNNDDIRHIAEFGPNGTFYRSITQISGNEVPASVMDYLTERHPDATYREIEKITERNGRITYSSNIENENYHFNKNGKIKKDKNKVKVKEKRTVERKRNKNR